MSIFRSNIWFRNKILGAVIFVFLFSTLFFGLPQKTHAQWVVTDPGATTLLTLISGGIAVTAKGQVSLTLKEYILDGIANFAAKMVIQRLTAQTVNWINSGFKGNPAYVTNPGKFFLNVGDNMASKFLSGTTLSALCQPFNAKVRLALVKNYIQEDQQNYACTIDKVVQNYDNFTRDFTQGGWNGWFSMTQNQTNNPMGAYMMAQNQLTVQIGDKQRNLSDDLNRGKGFLSFKKCSQWVSKSAIDAHNETQRELGLPPDPSGESEGDVNASGQVCKKSDVVTPGSVIAGQLDKSLGTSFDGLVTADEINEIISALMQQLVSRVVGGIGKGLRGASDSNAGERSLTRQIETSSETNSAESIDFNNTVTGAAPREVVPGNTPPVITLNGPSVVILTLGESFIDPGAIVNDAKDGSKIIMGVGDVNTATAGGYALTYTETNSLGIDAITVVRSVIVRDPASANPNPNGSL